MMTKIQLAIAVITLLIDAIAKFLDIEPDELRQRLIADPTICGKSTQEIIKDISRNLPDKK